MTNSLTSPAGRLSRLPVALLMSVALTSSAVAQYRTADQCDECDLCATHLSCCHEPPEFWIINTRCVNKCNNLDSGYERISYKRWDPSCRRFVRESRESFLAQEATMPTMFYIHGNTLKHKPAVEACWKVYNKLRCCPGKKRLVCWSWPAQVAFKRPLIRPRKLIEKNLKIKFVYAEYQGYYLAKLVDQMTLAQRVMLAGHSYGGTTAAAALHYLGGGCLRGVTLAGAAPVERANLRGAMISGAYDYDALIPGHRYGQAFVAAEKIYVTRNVRDKTLASWPKISSTGRRALGVIGCDGNQLGQYRHKLCQHTLTSDVGRSHYLEPHLASRKFVATLCCLSFPQCQSCQTPAAAQETPATPTEAPPSNEAAVSPASVPANGPVLTTAT